jgi:hypothetical protein
MIAKDLYYIKFSFPVNDKGSFVGELDRILDFLVFDVHILYDCSARFPEESALGKQQSLLPTI